MTSSAQIARIGERLAAELVQVSVSGSTLFVNTPLLYPNGTGVAVRVDLQGPGSFLVSDDGYAAFIAETMGAGAIFRRAASFVAGRAGLEYSSGTFVLSGVTRDALPTAVSAVANASARASERTAHSVEQSRFRNTRDLFESRLREAFGSRVVFDLEFRGRAGREWTFDGGVIEDDHVTHLYELVAPSLIAVAAANMKIGDAKLVEGSPSVTAALVDYEKTEPAFRAILSGSADLVIAANDDVARYRLRSVG